MGNGRRMRMPASVFMRDKRTYVSAGLVLPQPLDGGVMSRIAREKVAPCAVYPVKA